MQLVPLEGNSLRRRRAGAVNRNAVRTLVVATILGRNMVHMIVAQLDVGGSAPHPDAGRKVATPASESPKLQIGHHHVALIRDHHQRGLTRAGTKAGAIECGGFAAVGAQDERCADRSRRIHANQFVVYRGEFSPSCLANKFLQHSLSGREHDRRSVLVVTAQDLGL